MCITVGGLLIEPIIKQLGTAAASLAVYTTAAAAMFIAYQFNTFYPTLAERHPLYPLRPCAAPTSCGQLALCGRGERL